MTENPDLLTYLGQRFETVELDGQLWLSALELGQVMNLPDAEEAVNRLHQQHWGQFSDRLTAFVAVEAEGGPRLMRAFNLLGAYVLSTFADTLEAQQLRRWLLETLIYHQIDLRREYQRLLEQNAALEKRIAALEADLAALKQAFEEFKASFGPKPEKDWLDGEFSTLREQQARTGEALIEIAQALKNPLSTATDQATKGSAIAATLDELGDLRRQQFKEIDVLREIIQEIRAAQSQPPGNEYPPRMLALEGPFPVYLGRVGGRDCPVVSARDLHAFLNTRQANDFDEWILRLTVDNAGLSEHVDYEHLRWLHPEGVYMPTGNCILTLNAVLEIVRDRNDHTGGHIERFITECRQRLAAWMADSLQPPVAPWPDLPDFMEERQVEDKNQPEGPMVFYFGETPLNVIMQDGEPWFVAKEVCDALGIANSRDSTSVLDDDEKADVGLTDTSSNGVTQQRTVTVISESGFYTLALRCRDATKPGTAAYEFRRWVTKEILPCIHKTGRYRNPAHGNVAQPAPTAAPVLVTPQPPALPAQPAKANGKAKPSSATKPKPKGQAKPANGHKKGKEAE